MDANTLEIRTFEVTGSRVCDAPMLPELPDHIPADQPIDNASADRASDTRAQRKSRKRDCPCDPSPRPHIWRGRSGYHRRSLIEAKIRGFKRLDEPITARDVDRQVAALQIKVAILNLFTALATPNAWDESVRGKGKLRLRLICAAEPPALNEGDYVLTNLSVPIGSPNPSGDNNL